MAINSLSASSYGLSGLVSGMDTQSMVEKMLTGTQSKIDKATQKKMTLQNKQSMYREVAAKLRTLQNSYLSFTSKTNLLSNSFYNTMTTNISSPKGTNPAFSVTAGADANVGTVSMDYIKQLATARTEKTTQNASGPVNGSMDQSAAKSLYAKYTGEDAAMTITVGNKSMRIEDAPTVLGGMSKTELVDYLNQRFNDPNHKIAAEARFVNNKLQIIADDSEAYVTVQGNQYIYSENPNLSMKMFGAGVTTLSGKGTLSTYVDPDLYMPGFQVNLDGKSETIRIDLKALKAFANAADDTARNAAAQQLTDGIQDQLQRAFGAGVKVNYDAVKGDISFEAGASSQKFTINGDTNIMGMMGLTSGVSNKLNQMQAIKDLNFNGELQGNQHTFTINGVQFSYDSKAQLSTIINDINTSKAGVKITYLESEDKFMVQSSETGAGTIGFDVSQTEGNLMSVLFGARGGTSANGQGINMVLVAENTVAASEYSGGGTFTFNINGSDVKFTVKKQNNQTLDAATFASKMNDAFRDAYGYMADGTQSIRFMITQDGKFAIRANDPNYVVKTTKYHKDNNTSLLGFAEKDSTLATDADTTLKEAGIAFGAGSGIKIEFGGHVVNIDGSTISSSTTVDELAKKMTKAIRDELGIADGDTVTPHPKVEYDTKTASFKITANEAAPETVSITINPGNGTPREITIGIDVHGNGTEDIKLGFGEELLRDKTQAEIADLITDRIAQSMSPSDPTQRPVVIWDGSNFVLDGTHPTAQLTTMTDVGTGSSVGLDKLFGQMKLEVYQDEQAGFREVTDLGRNAVVSINGSEIERSTNTFTIDGLTYTLHDTTFTEKTLKAGFDKDNLQHTSNHENYEYKFDNGASKISVTRDTEKIVEGIQEFLKLYNETIDFINDMYKADATYKDYPPLTDAQKQSMSDREIELWEEKSKEGLLRNDQNLERVLSSLRTAMYTKPEGSSIAIYDLGITTSFYGNDGNFNAESIDKMRQAIENDPEALRQLFAGEGGIMELVNNAITNATKSSYGSPGYLVSVAGSNALDTSSSLYNQIKEIDDQLLSLEKRYWSEYDRYWKQFNTMEQLISQMNAQSGQMAQLMGG